MVSSIGQDPICFDYNPPAGSEMTLVMDPVTGWVYNLRIKFLLSGCKQGEINSNHKLCQFDKILQTRHREIRRQKIMWISLFCNIFIDGLKEQVHSWKIGWKFDIIPKKSKKKWGWFHGHTMLGSPARSCQSGRLKSFWFQ